MWIDALAIGWRCSSTRVTTPTTSIDPGIFFSLWKGMEYDGEWTLGLPPGAAAPPPDGAAPLLSNGTLGLVPGVASGHGLDTTASVVAGAEPWSSAPVDAFHFCRFRLHSPSLADTSHSLVADPVTGTRVALDLRTGTYRASFSVRRASDSVELCTATHELRALRHLPHFALHTLRLTVPAEHQQGFRVFHEVRTRLADPAYSSTFICSGDESFSAASSTYMLVGTGADGPTKVSMACCYLWEDTALVENAGYNTLRNDPSVALNRFVLRADPGAGGSSRTYTLHVLTGAGCCPSPAVEVDAQLRRGILSLLTRGDSPAAVAAQLLARHAAAWDALWITDIALMPKAGATPGDAEGVARASRALKYAMYNLHAASRAGGLGGVVDLEGTVAQGGHDAFLVPAYVMLRPDAAVHALDARFRGLEAAARAAAAFGLRGSKFRFESDDATGADDALFWDADVPLRIFNTALVAVNAWNYYRVTMDRDWLADRGYAVLRAVADLVASAAEPDAAEPAAFRIRGAVAMDDRDAPSVDNALTVACARLALQAATEAAYELGYPPKAAWREVRSGLRLPFGFPPGASAPILLRARAPDPPPGPVRVLEPLLVLSPWLGAPSGDLDLDTGGADVNALLRDNFAHWLAAAAASPEAVRSPVNAALRVQAIAQGSQVAPVDLPPDDVASALDAFLAAHSDAGWGNLTTLGSRSRVNDLNLSAALVLAVLQGIAGVRVVGGVTETRFYYAEMGLVLGGGSAAMPSTWERLIVKGLGPSQLDYVVLNSVLYPDASPGGGAGNTVPWSTDFLT
jgi:hypothetical protein